MKALTALSVASEIYPLIKTGGLADVTGALPAALQAARHRDAHAGAGLSGGAGADRGPAAGARFADLFGGPARLLAARSDELDLLVLDAPHLYARPGNPYVGADGKDWPDNAFRFARAGAGRRRDRAGAGAGFRPDMCMPMTGRPGWCRPICTTAAGRAGRRSSPSTTSPIRASFRYELLAQLGLPERSFSDGRRRILRRHRLSEGRAAARRPHHHGVADLRAWKSRGRRPAWASTACCGCARAHLSGILNGIDDEVWDPSTDARIAATYDLAHASARARRNKQAVQARFGLRAGARRAAGRRDQPAVVAEGARSAARGAADAARSSGMQLALLGSGDRGAGSRLPRRGAGAIRARSAW